MLKLKEVRNKKGYTIKEMASKLNISSAFYCQIENKKRNLSYEMAFKIASVLNTKPDQLFYDEFKKEL